MIKLRDTFIFIILIMFADRLSANYQFQHGCPFAQLQHAAGTVPEQPVLPSAAAAFARISYPNSIKTEQPYHDALQPISATGFSNIINSGTYLEPQLSAHSGHGLFTNYFAPKKSEKIQCAVPPLNCASNSTNNYYRTFDGSCNNREFPYYGMAKTRYTRMLAPKYSDGVYNPTVSVTGTELPNARLLSLSLYGEATLPDSFRTLAFLHWGQLVAHDMSEFTSQGSPDDCCANSNNRLCYPIALHHNGPISGGTGKTCMSFSRSTTDADANCGNSGLGYTEKLSLTTAFLDLSSIYGSSVETNRKIRQNEGGLLKATWANNRQWLPVSFNADGECGEGNYQCYNIPDRRNQFIPNIAILHTILLREHNRIANALAQLNPHYSDERIFQEARKINIAQFQKITYYDWLPLIIGPAFAYANNLVHYVQGNEYVNDYDATANTAPYAEFSAAAFRYAHNQIPGWFSTVAPNRAYNQTMRLSDYFERPENLNFISDGDNFDSLIRGLATQLQKRPDSNIDVEIKHHFDRKAFEQFGSDLKSLDIQRGRDYGLPSYNDLREYCGLQRAYDWSGFSYEISADKIAIMQKLYASPDDVDLSIGGSLETHAPQSILGPTFQCIIGKQFLKTRTGDRFFFEHQDLYSGFTRDQLEEVRKASISGLLCVNSDDLQLIQSNAFIFPNIGNSLTSCSAIPQIDLSKWKDVPQQPIY